MPKIFNVSLHDAIIQGNLDEVQALVKQGVQVNVIIDKYGMTPLQIAAYYSDQVNICRILVDNGANVTAKNHCGLTPLHYAANSGNLDIVKYLVANGARVHAQNYQGLKPLYYARFQGHVDIIKYLTQNMAGMAISDLNTSTHAAAELTAASTDHVDLVGDSYAQDTDNIDVV